MKAVVGVLFSFFLFVFVAHGQESFTAYGSAINFVRPDSAKWKLVHKGMHKQAPAYLVMFEHKPIKDAQDRDIKPVIGLICESVPDSLDVIKYSIAKRGQMPFKVNKMMTPQDGSFIHRNSVGYEGEYQRGAVLHKVFVGHLRHAGVGLQVICDSTDGVYDKVEADMRSFLRSLTFKE